MQPQSQMHLDSLEPMSNFSRRTKKIKSKSKHVNSDISESFTDELSHSRILFKNNGPQTALSKILKNKDDISKLYRN